MTKNFQAAGVEKTQLMIPIDLVRKVQFLQEARMSRCENSQASSREVISVTGSPG
jgi:hypothetical protein